MPTPPKGPRLGGSPAHERLMLANLASQLFQNHSITTTEHRAKRLRPYAEKLITLAKRGDTHARRQVLKNITDRGVVAELFEETAPKFAERNGGYTRITRVGNRKGDNAPMAVIALVLEPVSPKQAVVKEATKATQKGAEKGAEKSAAPAAEPTAAEAPTEEAAAAVEAVENAPDAEAPDTAETAEAPDAAETTEAPEAGAVETAEVLSEETTEETTEEAAAPAAEPTATEAPTEEAAAAVEAVENAPDAAAEETTEEK